MILVNSTALRLDTFKGMVLAQAALHLRGNQNTLQRLLIRSGGLMNYAICETRNAALIMYLIASTDMSVRIVLDLIARELATMQKRLHFDSRYPFKHLSSLFHLSLSFINITLPWNALRAAKK